MLNNIVVSLLEGLFNLGRGRGEDLQKKFPEKYRPIIKHLFSWPLVIGGLIGIGIGCSSSAGYTGYWPYWHGLLFAYPYIMMAATGTGGFMQIQIKDRKQIKMKEWILLDWICYKLARMVPGQTYTEEANLWGFWYCTLFGLIVFSVPFLFLGSLPGVVLMSTMGLYLWAFRKLENRWVWPIIFEFGWMSIYNFSLQYLFI